MVHKRPEWITLFLFLRIAILALGNLANHHITCLTTCPKKEGPNQPLETGKHQRIASILWPTGAPGGNPKSNNCESVADATCPQKSHMIAIKPTDRLDPKVSEVIVYTGFFGELTGS